MCRPRGVLGFWMALAAVATLGVTQLQIETSGDSILDRTDPAWHFYQETQETFGGDEILAVVIGSQDPFERAALAQVVSLTDAFEMIPGVRRVDSLSTVPLVHATPSGSVSLDPALARELPESADQIRAVAKRVKADRIAPRGLVSEDGRAFAINLVLEKGPEERYEAILGEVRRTLENETSWVSGVPIFRTEANSRTRAELALFVPLTVAVIAVLLFSLFGMIRAVVIPLSTTGLATWVILGLMGVLECPYND